MSRPVRVTNAYVNDLVAAIPLRFLDFLAEAQPHIVVEAGRSFDDPSPAEVDPDHDYVEIRGSWANGECDYVAIAQLHDDAVDLLAIEFDLDPLPRFDH